MLDHAADMKRRMATVHRTMSIRSATYRVELDWNELGLMRTLSDGHGGQD
jgi:hypothetical protein